MEPVCRLDHVSKIIGSKTIIEDISLDIYPGEVFGLLGPNGAGKTTTMRMMVGLMSMSKGNILIQGHSIRDHFEQAIAHVGAIIEQPQLYNYLTGYENLIHFARMAEHVTDDRIEEIVELVGLADRIDDKVKTYSLGMRQRLGLAQALLHSPSLLILDEPTNGLDPAGIREIRNYLRRLAQEEGVSVVVSSHLLAEMQLMCDRIAIIDKGKLLDVQSVETFLNSAHQHMITFTVDPLHQAVQVMEDHAVPVRHVTDHEFKVMLEKEQIPDVVQHLVQAKVKIYGIRPAGEKTLEERFLEMTGGKAQ
ncbi:ABC transporter ATP-binding protein [Caldalkalibacillus uzonensis]|nr:ABC transporter ATP-binding protein [Caldalkalibacillus uzonensis]